MNLTDSRLDQRPNTPIEPGYTAEEVDLSHEALDLGLLRDAAETVAVLVEGLEVGCDEFAAGRAGGKEREVAVEATPFGKVVGDVEGAFAGGRVSAVFISVSSYSVYGGRKHTRSR